MTALELDNRGRVLRFDDGRRQPIVQAREPVIGVIARTATECEELEVRTMPFKRGDIENLHGLVKRVLDELPEDLRPSPSEQRMTASEYGHWGRRIPRYSMVNIGVQRAANPSG